MKASTHRYGSATRLLLAAALSVGCLGCKDFDLRGDGFAESFNGAAQLERPPERAAPAFGVSTKAREIERDFGVK